VLDIKLIRKDPHMVKGRLAVLGFESLSESIDNIVHLDKKRRVCLNEVNDLKSERNKVSKEIGELKQKGSDVAGMVADMRDVGQKISKIDAEVSEIEIQIRDLMLLVPNLPLEEVPEGDAECNKVVRVIGSLPDFNFQPKPHWDLGENLNILDFPRGTKVSGSGFPVLKGIGAKLQRCLIDYMLDIHTGENGYTEVRVPYLVTSEALTGTGQLPKFADESYMVERDDLWLIPTAEVPVTNLHRNELIPVQSLPFRYVAYSPCFRREAGAAGADTRGLLRVHQFDKVELVRYDNPSRSREALEEITAEAESILQRLGLHYRVVILSTGDLGFSAAMTYDIEVWAPGVAQWLEVSSCSTFTDYQARRANIRYRPDSEEKPEFVHTLNGSALALPRLIVAILETYQQADGSVLIPEDLQERLGFSAIEI